MIFLDLFKKAPMISKTILTPYLLLILLSASFLELRVQNSIHEEKIRAVYAYLGKEDTVGINKAIDLYAMFSKTTNDSLKLILSKELITHLSETANFNRNKNLHFAEISMHPTSQGVRDILAGKTNKIHC